MNGGPLPANVIHEPTSLFDDHGRYIGENVSPAAEPDVTVSAPVDTEVNCDCCQAAMMYNFNSYFLCY